MAMFKSSKAVVVNAKPSFSDRLTGIKSIFRKSYDEACALKGELEEEIDTKSNKIAALKSEVSELQDTTKDVDNFMSNIQKFI